MTIARDDAASRGAALRRAVLAAAFLPFAPALAVAADIRSEGLASFYGREHHGGPTASGERFDMRAMTAAHRSAPLGSRLQVTNLKNGKSVVVRINDRGPFVRGRIIDLSRGAAEVLGFTGAGITRVAIRTVDAGTPAGPIEVAALDREEAAAASKAANGKPVLSDAERLMIDRTAGGDR